MAEPVLVLLVDVLVYEVVPAPVYAVLGKKLVILLSLTGTWSIPKQNNLWTGQSRSWC